MIFLIPFFAKAQIITTIAGVGTVSGFSGDGGPASAATMTETFGITMDAVGNMYISDYSNNRIRKIDTSGIITTFAGNGGGYSGDGGPATAAGIDGPAELVMFGTSLYVSEMHSSRVRKIDAAGIITTFAGNGSSGYSGDGGPATAAAISSPYGIGVDNVGNVYIPDQYTNHIRKVDTSGIITTFAGTGVAGYSGDGGAATLAEIQLVDDIKTDKVGNIYFCDYFNNVIRKVDTSGIITTFAGTGSSGFYGDGGPASAAHIARPGGLFIDTSGNIYISDCDNSRIRVINTSGIISTMVGTGSAGFSGDGGLAINAEIRWPNDMAMDSLGNFYFCDEVNFCVRKVTPAPISAVVPVVSQVHVGIYPNPANTTLSISSTETIRELKITDIKGKIVYSSHYHSDKIQVSIANFNAGVYFVFVNNKETSKFVKL
ncbi:NHL domain-containing protein [Flavipsychrobacter stenotrophus]|nr:T9SS type A sorting domain-containing protein [Flavipsychrobacter stenotrophus]